MTTPSVSASAHLVERPARALRARLDLALVRVWLLERDAAGEGLVPATVDAIYPAPHGGLDPVAAASATASASPLLVSAPAQDPRFGGALPAGGAVVVPLADGDERLGLLEAYAERALTFGDAAEIERSAHDIARAIVASRVTSGMVSSERGTILVCDDDPGIRSLLRIVLTKRGFAVIDVPNGLLALQRAKKERPDLVLIDWVMPVMDGRETTARLKDDAETRHIPIVMLTAQSQIEDKVSALEAGAQDFLTKPFDPRELVARVEQQLRWRKLLSDAPVESDEEAEAILTPPPRVPAADAAPPGGTAADVDTHLDPEQLTGDLWSRAVEAAQLGKHREALALYVNEAERCENERQFPRAAIAFRSASIEAGALQNPDLGNKLLRLAGKMYLTWSESTDDARGIQEGYLNAARCFLSAGNLRLAKKALDFANSYDAALADDHPSPL